MRKTTKLTVGALALTLCLGGLTARAQGNAGATEGGPQSVQLVTAPLTVDKNAVEQKSALSMPTAVVTGEREKDIAAFRAQLENWLKNPDNRQSFSEADQKLFKAGKFDVMYDRAIQYGNYTKQTK